ncbi:MAG TPA: bifunctional 23S rRNA (guanine(2069)-N(7))-methyltransferase RlmK/23S rRNA (guanine(2445)-N(2))-methyltransferase RlmL [Steroidobacteraceae bacterium]
MSAAEHAFVATVPRGLADLLLLELPSTGAQQARERGAAVIFTGSLEAGYRACLWSRIASRVLLQLTQFQAASAEEFYAQVRAFDWSAHIDPARTIACEFTGSHPSMTHSHYGALRLKDGICDRLRDDTGTRPDVALSRPAVRLHAHANGTHVTLSLDLAGEGLHRRGYRIEAGEAPLRENLAAGVLLRARWPEAAGRGAEFLDPMCGSGTLAIEAAMIAAHRAPGLQREYFGFLGWKGHDAALWQRLTTEAAELATPAIASIIRGSDIDQRALDMAAANAGRAGVATLIRLERSAVASVRPVTDAPGLICTNPPYGERLGDELQARTVFAGLGQTLREHFAGWDAAILTASPDTARELRLRSYRVHELWNGAIAVRLLRIDLGAPGAQNVEARRQQQQAEAAASPGGQMFANRLDKNLRRLAKLAQRAQVSCYRLYDADMPEYSFAIDRYAVAATAEVHLHVQEYAAPSTVDVEAARRRRREVLASLPGVLQIPPERIHLRLRTRQSGSGQYQRQRALTGSNADERRLTVEEGGLKFLVNLDDYLDTGLFLDHRLTRQRLRELAPGARFLNLFCYTSSATVYAASGGARSSVSVDLSGNYLDWAAGNFKLNGLDPAHHRLERADCRQWLREADAHAPFDLIFLDPPTFSNSKRMQGVLDVQRDHPELIELCLRLLAPGGVLLFSTNAQRFRPDPVLLQRWQVRDISARMLPFDFERNPRIHRCFEINAPPA